MNEQNNDGIFSSTGDLGTSIRQDSRLYRNETSFTDDPQILTRRLSELAEEAGTDTDEISRIVWRGLVSNGVMQYIVESGLERHMEIAFPVSEFNQTGWLVYLARNASHRQALLPITEMAAATNGLKGEVGGRPQNTPNGDFDIVTQISDVDQTELLELWSDFGWENDQIAGLARRMDSEQGLSPPERSVWFSAVLLGGKLICAAEAERLTIPGHDGSLDLVESTEWRTHEQFQNLGFMSHNLRSLHMQVLSDLEGSPNGPPLIYAECNYTSRSDRAGYRVGLRIPSRDYAAQMAIQNVVVNDGYQPVGLRDFTFMYLPVNSQECIRRQP